MPLESSCVFAQEWSVFMKCGEVAGEALVIVISFQLQVSPRTKYFQLMITYFQIKFYH